MVLKLVDRLFLDALKASLEGREVDWSGTDILNTGDSEGQVSADDISPEDILHLLEMAQVHNVLPMIFQAIYRTPAFLALPPQYQMGMRRDVIHSVAMQAMKTSEFQLLYEHLRQGGATPCVVKGLICRNLYPNPDDRMSGDEDVFIPEEEFEQVHQLMLEYGMVLSNPDEDIHKVYEVPYGKVGSPLYIELHKHLFPLESEAYGDMNRYFEGIHKRGIQAGESLDQGRDPIHRGKYGLIEEEINGTKFLTMNHTDHLFYLICHSFKHFLHSGFGIRQVCDIILYANAYGADVDWEYVLESCREIRADLFAAAMFKMGEKYLTFDREKACYPECWRKIEVDEADMLQDLLASGVYGQADMSRKHSSNITLNAVIADKRGQKAKTGMSGVLSSVFLPRSSLEGRFPYLKRFPFLLPVAWVQRVWIYKKETSKNQAGNNAAESIKIGNQRVEMLKKYGIIK